MVKIIKLSLELEKNLKGFNCIHLASGKETSVQELANTLMNISGLINHPINYLDARKGEVERNFASYDLAKKILNFEPETSIYDGLLKTWEWSNSLNL